jgi:hypothetical protein
MVDKPKQREELMEQEVGDELMLYDALGRQVHVLNLPARYIWIRCDGGHTAEEIAEEIAGEFGVERDAALADVRECLADFSRLGVLAD